ncbi:hypothetical protein [Streptomyces sp. NPDC055036]
MQPVPAGLNARARSRPRSSAADEEIPSMFTPQYVLVAPVDEGGEFVFAHAFGSGIRVWTRGLVRRVDERPDGPAVSPPRCTAGASATWRPCGTS